MTAAAVPWYEEAFRGDYVRVYPHRDDAAAAAEAGAWVGRLPGLAPGARALDLACGAGRHLRALRALGVRAAGADLSGELLDEATRRGAAPLVRAEMRALPFRAAAFDAVTCFFSSFGYFPSEEEDARVLREVARVLRVDGGFLLDLMDAETVRRTLVPRSRRERDGVVVEEERRLVAAGGRVEKSVHLSGPDGERQWTESVRLYGPGEVETSARAAGLRPAGRFGGHGGEPWVAGGTARMVLVFRRA